MEILKIFLALMGGLVFFAFWLRFSGGYVSDKYGSTAGFLCLMAPIVLLISWPLSWLLTNVPLY